MNSATTLKRVSTILKKYHHNLKLGPLFPKAVEMSDIISMYHIITLFSVGLVTQH